MDSGVDTFPQPLRLYAHIPVDVAGPLPASQGHHYLFTVINRSTCWTEALPMGTLMSALCTSALLSGWIAIYGISEHITSDRGASMVDRPNSKSLGLNTVPSVKFSPGLNPIGRSFNILATSYITDCSSPKDMTDSPMILYHKPRKGQKDLG
ncbi:uncharacterized protein [Palaemon carinicauda]|uniref:uncharacterized protein n=1 Tax=Palaemon carinicauda TaxID=392227 RepID=UPI0035B68341